MDKRFIKCALKWSKKPECVGKKELPLFGDWYIVNKNNFGGFNKWNDEVKNILQNNYFGRKKLKKCRLKSIK